MKRREIGNWIFSILIIVAAIWMALVPFNAMVRETHMRRFHASTGSFPAWAVLQAVPSMYNFYNERWPVYGDASLDEFLAQSGPGLAVNHYPLSGLTYPFAPGESTGPQGMVLRSRYRGATLATRYRILTTATGARVEFVEERFTENTDGQRE